MTDDLVDRLRELDTWVETAHTPIEAADRIEQLERALSISRMAQVVMDNSGEALTAQLQVSNELGRALEEDAGQLRADNERLRGFLKPTMEDEAEEQLRWIATIRKGDQP